MAGVTHGPQEDALYKAMAALTFDVMGSTRSHWDFYRGEGWYLSLTKGTFAVLLWSMSNAVSESPALVRRLTGVCTLFFAITVGLCARWFFAAPLVCSIVAMLACAGAWFRLKA